MPFNKCCVVGCNSESTVQKHVFPLDDGEFATWVQLSGNNKLKCFIKEYIGKTFLVRCRHFDSNCYSFGTTRLKKGSLPCLKLPSIFYITILNCG